MSEPRPEFICPITYELMFEPVQCAFGHNYEREAIEKWYRDHNTSPVSGRAVPHKYLTPNIYLRNEICEWRAKNNIPDPEPKPAGIFVENLSPSSINVLHDELPPPPPLRVNRTMPIRSNVVRFQRLSPSTAYIPSVASFVSHELISMLGQMQSGGMRGIDELMVPSVVSGIPISQRGHGYCFLRRRYQESQRIGTGYINVKVLREGCGVCAYCINQNITNNNNNG